MFESYLLWFIFFLKFKDTQFADIEDYARTTSLTNFSNDSLTLLPLNTVGGYNELIPFYAVLNGTVTLINNFRTGQEHRRRHLRKSLYSDWSDWSFCSNICTTVRQKHCLRPKICGLNILTETSYCFTENSKCLGLIKNYKRSNWNYSNKGIGDVFVPINFTCGSVFDSHTIPGFKTSRYLVRIMGGQKAKKFRWPWQVAVLNGFKELICGGTVVAPGWVLTAAHCSRRKLYVILREFDVSIHEGDEIEIKVERVIIHPRYNPNTIDNDVALLKLRTLDLAINGGYHLEPACLPVFDPRRRKRKPKMCVAIGWGKTRPQDSYGSQILREVRVPIVGQRTCRAAYRRHLITDNMFCAGYRDGRSDTCSGDSGGPLLCQMRGRWTVVGVTSFGDGCGRRGKYGIYASVANHVPWMTSVITSRRPFHHGSIPPTEEEQ